LPIGGHHSAPDHRRHRRNPRRRRRQSSRQSRRQSRRRSRRRRQHRGQRGCRLARLACSPQPPLHWSPRHCTAQPRATRLCRLGPALQASLPHTCLHRTAVCQDTSSTAVVCWCDSHQPWQAGLALGCKPALCTHGACSASSPWGSDRMQPGGATQDASSTSWRSAAASCAGQGPGSSAASAASEGAISAPAAAPSAAAALRAHAAGIVSCARGHSGPMRHAAARLSPPAASAPPGGELGQVQALLSICHNKQRIPGRTHCITVLVLYHRKRP
jgi:hypothetical protein